MPNLPEMTLLVVTPGSLTTQQLESRPEVDTSKYTFFVSNLTTSLVRLVNIQLYLIFSFKGLNVTINGVSTSTPFDPLKVSVDGGLIPGQVQPVSVDVMANVGGVASPVQQYPFTILATYDTEPFPAITQPSPVSGGAQLFAVVPD